MTSTTSARAPSTPKPKPRWRRSLSLVLNVALIVLIFGVVIPQFANYSQAWAALKAMSTAWLVALIVAAVVVQLSVVWPYQAVLSELRYRHGFLETQTTTAISNTVPAGGAVAVGVTFRMFGSFGYSNLAISSAVATTGVWSLAFKLGFPVVVAVLVVATGQSLAGAAGAIIAGFVVIVVCGVVVWLLFRSESTARKLGHRCDRVVNWLAHFAHKPASDQVEAAAVHFRAQANDTVHQRGWLLTVTVLARESLILVLVFICVRSVGITVSQVSALEVLLAIAVARLVGAIPLTPGGLGTIDAAFIGMLTALGANSSEALAADLLWRATTYFPPIFIGVVTYFFWKRGVARGVYTTQPGLKEQTLSGG